MTQIPKQIIAKLKALLAVAPATQLEELRSYIHGLLQVARKEDGKPK